MDIVDQVSDGLRKVNQKVLKRPGIGGSKMSNWQHSFILMERSFDKATKECVRPNPWLVENTDMFPCSLPPHKPKLAVPPSYLEGFPSF